MDESVKDVIHVDGIKFAAMKVSSISGDARRVLDICRFLFCVSPMVVMLILSSW
jgi:origin recognition complex subunit 1